MKLAVFRLLIVVLLLLGATVLRAECPVLASSGKPVGHLGDPLFAILHSASECPNDVIEFRALLENEGAAFTTTMVANRGFHNPKQGSFSFFEMVTIEKPKHFPTPVAKDQFLFGHFTTPGPQGTLALDQNPNVDSLMIELIVWDGETETYNFYELIGSQAGSHWFYRGNSTDIYRDIKKLHLKRSPGEPKFGKTLRCAGCHISGGPIMKEITAPHDSWWSKFQPLPLTRTPDANVAKVMETLDEPSALSTQVESGLQKLMKGKAFQAKQGTSPQMALRPLFCPEELNLQPSQSKIDGRDTSLSVPAGFFLDPRFGVEHIQSLDRQDYMDALTALKSKFPETSFQDADHLWNTPVKAAADIAAIQQLPGVSEEFLMDVLAIDMTRPVFSAKRCALLQQVPAAWTPDWVAQFKGNLKNAATPAALELLENFSNPAKTAAAHKARATLFAEACGAKLQTAGGVLELVKYLGQVRAEAFTSEISQNPLGQILEPGFRVIFPVFSPAPKPGALSLDEQCNLI